LRGEPSHVWRDGQARRLEMIVGAAGENVKGRVLENGCGICLYVEQLIPLAGEVVGLEYDGERAKQAALRSNRIVNAAGERLPFARDTFDLILSHEVLEHMEDDHLAVSEMLRVLRRGGRLVLFTPNRGYPVETHGIYWRNRYHFGNKLFINYLPRRLRDKLAPHVRAYSGGDMLRLFAGQEARIVRRTVIFGGYDNLIARFGAAGKLLRAILQFLEGTPLRGLGLSHFWVVEKA